MRVLLTILVVLAVAFGWVVVFAGWHHSLGAGLGATAVWGCFTVVMASAVRDMWWSR